MGKNKNKNQVKAPEPASPAPDNHEEKKQNATATIDRKVTAKHFPITDKESFVQYSLQMSESEYTKLINGDGDIEVNHSPGKNKMLLQCLDVSGSMYGRTMESLIEGCLQLGNRYFSGDKPAFEKFVTMTHHHSIDQEFVSNNKEDYEKQVKKFHAHGGNNFLTVFQRIKALVMENPGLEQLEIIFVTDGHDCMDGYRGARNNYAGEVNKAIDEIKDMGCKVRYMCIGFSANHNAQQMNQIANSGTDQGNFTFVDTQFNDFPQRIAEALGDSFDMALGSDSAVKFRIENQQEDYTVMSPAEISYTNAEVFYDAVDADGKGPVVNNEEKKADDVDMEDPEIEVIATVQQVQKTALVNELLQVTVVTKSGEYVCSVQVETTEEPKPEMLIKARLEHNKKRLFDYIQDLQKKPLAERKKIYDEIRALDKQIDQDQDMVIKIKDKSIRTDLMETFVFFKNQITALYAVMKKDAYENLDNLTLAQLNDAAYKAIRKTGNQKRLDERAMKNKEMFDKLDLQLAKAMASIHTDKLKEDQQVMKVVESIGDCPVSLQDTIGCIEAKDCMCIGLEISRSEACINDPSRLVIREVLPCYISLDSFLESSIFKLKTNQDASGGFDYDKQGELAIGAGRESISGILPLFLFKEHWEIAKRKIQPLLGFMCTLDPLGYTSSQYFAVPFLVLQKAIENSIHKESEKNTVILEQVQETCSNMIVANNQLKQQIVDQTKAFVKDAQSRTADVVPSLSILCAQMFSYENLSDEKKAIAVDPQNVDQEEALTQADFKKFTRFVAEETSRRNLKRDAKPLERSQILSILLPDYANIVQEYKSAFKAQIEKRLAGSDKSDPYEMFKETADKLRKKAKGDKEDDASPEEEVKAESQKDANIAPVEEVSMDQVVKLNLDKLPWIASLADKGTTASKIIKGGCNTFDKHQTPLIYMLSKLEGREVPYKGLLEIFENSSEMALATLMQNCLHPKNANRVDAVKSGNYVEIATPEVARDFLMALLKKNLEHELLSAESQVNETIAKLSQMHDVKVLMEAPDVFIAAAALSTQKFCQGKGDRTAFFNMILESNPAQIPDLGRKLNLVTKDKFMGLQLYSDKLALCDRVKRKMVYLLWLHCCRKNDVIPLKQMIEFQPQYEEVLIAYDKFVDAEGRTTLNQEEHTKYRKDCAVKKEKEAKKKAAEKSKKKHF